MSPIGLIRCTLLPSVTLQGPVSGAPYFDLPITLSFVERSKFDTLVVYRLEGSKKFSSFRNKSELRK
jgi:hypothetical protein